MFSLRSYSEFCVLRDYKFNPQKQGGLAAAFDLAAYEGYMIARVKRSVNHSRIIQSMRETVFHFCFGAILDFLIHGRTENVYKVAT